MINMTNGNPRCIDTHSYTLAFFGDGQLALFEASISEYAGRERRLKDRSAYVSASDMDNPGMAGRLISGGLE